MRRSRLGVALILTLVGIIWIAQGTGVIAGSAMSGPVWAVAGTALVILAIGLVLLERRRAGIQRG